MGYRLFIILMMMTITYGCAKPKIIYQDFASDQVLHYSQIGKTEIISNKVFYLNKGDIIPVKITLDSELLDVANEEFNLVLKQKVYFRVIIPEGMHARNKAEMSEESKQELLKHIMIYLSLDAKRWAAYTDIKAVKEAFGISGGSFSIGIGMTKEDGISVYMNAKTNRM